jgi:transcriptional regulator with XRE-family HTH domain
VSVVFKRLGRRLRELRMSAGLSQEQLGAAAGLTAKYISLVENGHVNASVGVLHAIAEKALKMPLATVFAFDTSATEAMAEIREVEALLAGQARRVRRRALHVLRALVEPLR